MKTSGQFQKKASTQSAPIPLSTNLFHRPFPKPSATVEEASTDTPDFQARLEFARSHAPDLSSLAANSSGDRAPSTVQPKLTVGAPNDQYEQEADRVADQVMSMPDSATQQPIQREAMPEEEEVRMKPLAASITPLVQREAMPEEEELHAKAIDHTLQREEMPEEELRTKPALQRSPDGSLEAGSSIESRLNNSKGGGSPLSDDVRSFMEPRFGADFSQVRVHTGSEAVQMNRDLNAQAFAHTQDVYFGAGKAPGKDSLTAHELTHVVQQTNVVQTKLTQNTPDVQQKYSACEAKDTRVRRKEDGNAQVVQRKIGDGHDLTSPRFAGDSVLEACFDGKHRMLLGETGSAVEKVQQALTDSGLPLKIDGIFGPKTQAAVAKFKLDNGITPSDGVVGSGTMAELDQRFQGQTPLPHPLDPPIVPVAFQRKDFAFIMSSDKEEAARKGRRLKQNEHFYDAATSFFEQQLGKAVQIGNAEIVRTVRSLEGIFEYLRNVGVPVGRLFIVSHGADDGTLEFALRKQDEIDKDSQMTIASLQKALSDSETKRIFDLPPHIIDKATTIEIKGCKIGRSQKLLDKLDEAFDKGEGTVTAATNRQGYRINNQGVAEEFFQTYFIQKPGAKVKLKRPKQLKAFMEQYPHLSKQSWEEILPKGGATRRVIVEKPVFSLDLKEQDARIISAAKERSENPDLYEWKVVRHLNKKNIPIAEAIGEKTEYLIDKGIVENNKKLVQPEQHKNDLEFFGHSQVTPRTDI